MLALNLVGQHVQLQAYGQADDHEQRGPQDCQECKNGIG